MHGLKSILLVSTDCLTVCSAKEVGSKRATKESKQKAIYPVDIDIFGFKNRDYFENPGAKIETIRDRLHEENSDAILLGAPSFVPLDKTKKFPMSSLRITESLKAYKSPFHELAKINPAVDRNLKAMVSSLVVKKVGAGLYLKPRKTRFGLAPSSDEDLVRAFLKTDDFLLNSYSNYNALGFGLTQVYNQTLVYNHKRHGKFVLGGRKFEFRNVPAYPKELTKEYLVVDMLNNLKRLPDNSESVLQTLPTRIKQFKRNTILEFAKRYGSAFTKKQLA